MKIRSDESLSSWRVVRSSRRKSQQQQEKQLSSRMLRWMQRSMCLSAQTGKPSRSLSMVDGEGDQTQLREISEACLLNPSPDSDTLAPKDRTALLCYTLNRMPTRPDLVQATLSGHGHARTKAAPGLIIIQSRRATLPADPTRAFDATVRTHECQDARTHVAAPNRTGRVDSS